MQCFLSGAKDGRKSDGTVPMVLCPECGGEIVERKGKKGRTFFGCRNYPTCEYVSWDKPTGQLCPACGAMMVEKTGKNKEKAIICPKCK